MLNKEKKTRTLFTYISEYYLSSRNLTRNRALVRRMSGLQIDKIMILNFF